MAKPYNIATGKYGETTEMMGAMADEKDVILLYICRQIRVGHGGEISME